MVKPESFGRPFAIWCYLVTNAGKPEAPESEASELKYSMNSFVFQPDAI